MTLQIQAYEKLNGTNQICTSLILELQVKYGAIGIKTKSDIMKAINTCLYEVQQKIEARTCTCRFVQGTSSTCPIHGFAG